VETTAKIVSSFHSWDDLLFYTSSTTRRAGKKKSNVYHNPEGFSERGIGEGNREINFHFSFNSPWLYNTL
jgi:hypothetical protein